jgi:hypothetical protein
MPANSYLSKTFLVDNADARIRKAKNSLLKFQTYAEGEARPPGKNVGDARIIPKGTMVRILDAVVHANGIVFGLAATTDGGVEIGWTSTWNLKGQFVGETLVAIPPRDNKQKGDNAAWSRGEFIGQVTLVQIVDVTREIEVIAEGLMAPFQGMVGDAAQDGVSIFIRSGFRTFAEQKFLHDGFVAGRPGFNRAAPPGSSNHQNGIALDIYVKDAIGEAAYAWLKQNGPAHGFIRTVNGEPWHWEFLPTKAAQLAAQGKFKLASVHD